MTEPKKVGRPKCFEREEALARATCVFWKHGYEGASMTRLTDAMGISSPSLYAEFGDKKGLYLEAIKSYVTNDACAPLVALETERDIGKAVTAFFEAALEYATDHESGTTGCFLASCVATSAGHMAGSAQLLRDAIKATDKRIQRRFEQEILKGTLPETFPTKDRAKLLFDLRQGLVFRARAGFAEITLRAEIENYVRAVLAPA